MRVWGLVCGALCVVAPATAQDWATRETCHVERPALFEEVFPAPGLAALETRATEVLNGRGRFWQVTAPNGAVSHLWGTFHASDAAVLRLPDPVKATLEASSVVALEYDPVFPTRQAVRDGQYVAGQFNEASDPFAAVAPGDGPLDHLSDEMAGWVLDRAIELGWSEDADLILSTAGMAGIVLGDPCEDFASGVLPLQDDYLQLLAHLAGVPVLGLEAPDAFYDDLATRDETARAIIAVYAAYLQPQADNRGRSTSIALYGQGRIGLMQVWDQAFLRSVLASDAPLAATDDYLLNFRNTRFLDTAEPALKAGGAFIGVGAFHLPGANGMVEGLRARGYEVERIVLPGEAP
ncbi:MAG: TraB/GumN family protein [Silicimonas sp.]|nr:TraB/GumN family protein [Silicimonas sp.]